MSDPVLSVTSRDVITGMTGNSHFTSPTPTLAELTAATEAFQEAVANAELGGSYEKALKREKKLALSDLLHRMGNYILFKAEGNEAIARSSGFPLATNHPSPVVLDVASNIVLKNGPSPNEISGIFPRPKGARSFLYQYTKDPLTDANQWQTFAGTIRKFSFSGLTNREKYWVRVVAIGGGGQITYSDPVSIVVY